MPYHDVIYLPYFFIIAMTMQECSYCKYFQNKILKFEKIIMLFIPSLILILKGKVKNYTH